MADLDPASRDGSLCRILAILGHPLAPAATGPGAAPTVLLVRAASGSGVHGCGGSITLLLSPCASATLGVEART